MSARGPGHGRDLEHVHLYYNLFHIYLAVLQLQRTELQLISKYYILFPTK